MRIGQLGWKWTEDCGTVTVVRADPVGASCLAVAGMIVYMMCSFDDLEYAADKTLPLAMLVGEEK